MTRQQEADRLVDQWRRLTQRFSPIRNSGLIRSSQGEARYLQSAKSGLIWGEDSSGNFSLFNAAGTKLANFDASGNLVFPSTTGIKFTDYTIQEDGSGFLSLVAANGFKTNSSGVVKGYNNILTAGLGVPVIYASSVQSKSNAAPTTVSYTPPATAGTYRANVYVEIVTATTITLKLKITYTSASGAATTDVIELTQEGSNSLTNAPANTADRYWGVQPINIDNSAGAIALADNAGTYTTCAYRLAYWLEQVI